MEESENACSTGLQKQEEKTVLSIAVMVNQT